MLHKTESTQGFAEVNGAQLYYEIAGSGRSVVLVHAGIANHRMWDDQFALFAQRYQVLRYDQRGFGQSTMPAGPFAFHDDLYALLRELQITRTSLIGVSMGGMTTINLTLAHPELVEGLLLVGSGVEGLQRPPLHPEEQALFDQEEEAEQAGDFVTANELEVHIWVDGPRRKPEDVNLAVRARIREMNMQGFNRLHEQEQAQMQHLEPPASQRLGEIRVPTLVMVGDQDLSRVHVTADLLVANIRGARKVVIPDAAHVPNMERPEAFNQIVFDFLDQLHHENA